VLAGDAEVSRRAARQKRVVTWAQLVDAGLSRRAVARRLDVGTLQRLWRGVYLVGPGRPDAAALAMAAVLTCGDAVVSHRWAAGRWRFLDHVSLPVDVTVVRGSHRGRREVRVHRTILLDSRDFTTLDGIPITAPARTLLDLAAVTGPNVTERAVAEAMVLKRVNERHLREVIARSGRHPGAAALSAALTQCPDLTRSEAERMLRRPLKRAGLPDPRANQRVHGYEVDFSFPGSPVIIEVDGLGPHGTPRAFERDRRKRSVLAAKGYRVLVFTYRQLTEEPHWVVAQVAEALAQSSYVTAGEFDRRTSASMPVAGSGREK
jgi:very-short-patch-repair endonuclease